MLGSFNRQFLLLVAAVCAASSSVRAQTPPSVAIQHAAIVDILSGQVHSDQTVVIIGNRIVAVRRASQGRVPRGARIVDARGKCLSHGSTLPSH